METTVIDKVIPKSRDFKFGSKEIKVKKFRFRQFPKVIQLFNKVQKSISPDATDAELTAVVFGLFSDDLDTVMEIVGLSTGLTIDELDEIEFEEPEKFKAIMEAVVEVNADFLERVQGLIPQKIAPQAHKTTP